MDGGEWTCGVMHDGTSHRKRMRLRRVVRKRGGVEVEVVGGGGELEIGIAQMVLVVIGSGVIQTG